MNLLDRQGAWIRKHFGTQNQVRLGVIMTDLGALLTFGVFVVSEPPLIYIMSALALLFAGIGTVVTAVLAQVEEEERDG